MKNRFALSVALAASMTMAGTSAALAQDEAEAEAEDTGMPPGLPTMADFGAVDRQVDVPRIDPLSVNGSVFRIKQKFAEIVVVNVSAIPSEDVGNGILASVGRLREVIAAKAGPIPGIKR